MRKSRRRDETGGNCLQKDVGKLQRCNNWLGADTLFQMKGDKAVKPIGRE